MDSGGEICRLDEVWLYVSTCTGGSIDCPASSGGCHDSSGLNGGTGLSCAWTGEISVRAKEKARMVTSKAIKIFFMCDIQLPNTICSIKLTIRLAGAGCLTLG